MEKARAEVREFVMRPSKLWKTTLVIWSDYDPRVVAIDTLATHASWGDSYCSKRTDVEVIDASKFPPTDFFGLPDEL